MSADLQMIERHIVASERTARALEDVAQSLKTLVPLLQRIAPPAPGLAPPAPAPPLVYVPKASSPPKHPSVRISVKTAKRP